MMDNREYLGDGVYGLHEYNEIFLESEVVANLRSYLDRYATEEEVK